MSDIDYDIILGFCKWDLTNKLWPLKSDLRNDEVFNHQKDGRSFGTCKWDLLRPMFFHTSPSTSQNL